MSQLVPESSDHLPILDVRHYVKQSLSDNTRRAYQADLEHFRGWGGGIPATPDKVADYLSSHGHIHAVATLQRRIVSIGIAHKMQGYADPTKSELVRLTMRGIRRVHGKPQKQMSPILKDDLIVMVSQMPDTIKGIRDKAMLMIGFAGALRRSELAAIRLEDLEFTTQGIILTLPRSKTDQDGVGRKIGIPKGRGRVCPVASVSFWMEKSLIKSGPLFPSIKKGGLILNEAISDRSVGDIVKAYVERAGLDPSRYSGHSLRSGLATSAAQHGISSWKIRQQTGHKSDLMLARYIRDGDIFTDNAAALF